MDTFDLHRRMLEELGAPILKTTQILDWGCGAGAYVASARKAGFVCVGCDFNASGEHLSAIGTPYRLPYPDESFDLVVSSGVLEHCMDYDASIAELARVMRPGAAFLHFFPSRWALLEHHIHVPLAGFIQAAPWLRLWALAGVRNGFQRGLASDEVVRRNQAFLKSSTNYLPHRDIARRMGKLFSVRFCEDVFFRHTTSRARHIPSPLAPIYRTLHNCMMFGRKN